VPDGVYTYRYGNVLETSLAKVLDTNIASNTKDSIRRGIIPTECSQCELKEAVIGHSRRKFFNDILNPMLIGTKYDYSKNFHDIYFLEFNMSNICNLKCRMCNGISSSAWVKEEIKLNNISKDYMRPVNHLEFGYTNRSKEIIERLFEDPIPFMNLRYLSIKGGEPYMEPANKTILKKFIDLGLSKNITIDLTTNGTKVDEELHELANQYGYTKWTVSLEGTDLLYQYIRGDKHYTFSMLQENLKSYEQFDRLIIAVTIMAYNIAHLEEIKTWYDSISKNNYRIYFNNVVVTPPYLNPRILPDNLLQNINYKLPNFNYTQDKNLVNLLPTFISFTRDLDKLRDTNILDVCPEFNELFV
jgi:MoaA/NifB/PqqE/SkfB family radical SAM enzyme